MYNVKLLRLEDYAEWTHPDPMSGAGPGVAGSTLKRRARVEVDGEQMDVLVPCDANGDFLDTALHQEIFERLKLKPQRHALEKKTIAYQDFATGTAYKIGDMVIHSAKLYQVIQAHTSQSDWAPDKTPALFKSTLPAGQIGEWKQPAGAHDAYKKGDKVLFNGKTYESLIDANVWSPSVYPQGWKLIG